MKNLKSFTIPTKADDALENGIEVSSQKGNSSKFLSTRIIVAGVRPSRSLFKMKISRPKSCLPKTPSQK